MKAPSFHHPQNLRCWLCDSTYSRTHVHVIEFRQKEIDKVPDLVRCVTNTTETNVRETIECCLIHHYHHLCGLSQRCGERSHTERIKLSLLRSHRIFSHKNLTFARSTWFTHTHIFHRAIHIELINTILRNLFCASFVRSCPITYLCRAHNILLLMHYTYLFLISFGKTHRHNEFGSLLFLFRGFFFWKRRSPPKVFGAGNQKWFCIRSDRIGWWRVLCTIFEIDSQLTIHWIFG